MHIIKTTFKIPCGFIYLSPRWNLLERRTCPSWSPQKRTTLVGSRAEFPVLPPLFIALSSFFPSLFPRGPINLWSAGESFNDPDDGKSAMEGSKWDFPVERPQWGTGDVFCLQAGGILSQGMILAGGYSGRASSQIPVGNAWIPFGMLSPDCSFLVHAVHT